MRGVYFTALVLIPKRQPEIQIDLNSSELPNEIRTSVEKDTVKKIMYYKKTCKYSRRLCSRNALQKMFIDFTRYIVTYCS